MRLQPELGAVLPGVRSDFPEPKAEGKIKSQLKFGKSHFTYPLFQSLKLFGLTVTGNSFPVQIHPGLETFELRQVKVMDVAFGAYVFPSDDSRVVCLKSDECCSYSSSDCE